MLRPILTILFLLLLCPAIPAAEIAGDKGVTMTVDLPDGWAIHHEPPEALIEEIAEHVEHEAEAAGKHPTPEQIRNVARKRLASNEAIIYHAASGSHLDVDFSALDADEQPPSSKTLKMSAKFATESLEGEEGVSKVDARVERVDVKGARETYRLDASYLHHVEPVAFIGYIGFVEPVHWYFLYFTAPGKDAEAMKGIEEILKSIEIKTAE